MEDSAEDIQKIPASAVRASIKAHTIAAEATRRPVVVPVGSDPTVGSLLNIVDLGDIGGWSS